MIERREFEYIRHGTVNFAAALIVHDGQMRGWCLDKDDSECKFRLSSGSPALLMKIDLAHMNQQ